MQEAEDWGGQGSEFTDMVNVQEDDEINAMSNYSEDDTGNKEGGRSNSFKKNKAH